jgi:hypothetical protein
MMSAFVVDYGLQLTARNEVQNAVDAAALAGAEALAFDDYSEPRGGGRAYLVAESVAQRNLVAGEAASVSIDADLVCNSTWDANHEATAKRACIQIIAYRDADHENPIAGVIGRLMNVNTFGVVARAIAEATTANSTKCLKPIAIPDRWQEWSGAAWDSTQTFDRWSPANPAVPVADPDTYASPTAFDAGTGLTFTGYYGAGATLDEGQLTTPIATIKPWQYLPIEIPGSQWAGAADPLRSNTSGCANAKVTIGDQVPLAAGDVHLNATSIAAGLQELIGRDPDAIWDPITRRVKQSCADRPFGDPLRCGMSPRIIAVALYDPADVADQSTAGVPATVLVTNVVGFFVDTVTDTTITGFVTRHPGLHDDEVNMLTDDASFMRAPMLVE